MEEISEDILNDALGRFSVQDKAKYLASLFINDIAKVIQQGVDPTFDGLYDQLQLPPIYTDNLILNLVTSYIAKEKPSVIGLTVPFPDSILGALKISQCSKQVDPEIKIILGSGFVNTELRSLKDLRRFEFVDYITLDDGERPFITLLEYLNQQRPVEGLFRTYRLNKG